MSAHPHPHPHAFPSFLPLAREGLVLPSRRNVLKASLAGIAGLSLPQLLKARESGVSKRNKSLILLWMTGGPIRCSFRSCVVRCRCAAATRRPSGGSGWGR